jgi:hypothetical protein
MALDRGISEFGQRLGDHVHACVGCRGAVLTDDDGHPVDYACRTEELTALEIQIVGAQCERALADLRHHLDLDLQRLTLGLSADRGRLLARTLDHGYVLAALYDPAAIADHSAFADLTAQIERLLG